MTSYRKNLIEIFFVIIANDDSDYSKELMHNKEMKELNRLTNELKMDPNNAEIKNKLEFQSPVSP